MNRTQAPQSWACESGSIAIRNKVELARKPSRQSRHRTIFFEGSFPLLNVTIRRS